MLQTCEICKQKSAVGNISIPTCIAHTFVCECFCFISEKTEVFYFLCRNLHDICSYIFCFRSKLFVICVTLQVVHILHVPRPPVSHTQVHSSKPPDFLKYFSELEIERVVLVVHVVAPSSIRDCTTDGREVYFYRAQYRTRIISCCRKKICKEINAHIIGHTKLRQGISVMDYVYSINQQIFAEALLSRYGEIVRNLTRNSYSWYSPSIINVTCFSKQCKIF